MKVDTPDLLPLAMQVPLCIHRETSLVRDVLSQLTLAHAAHWERRMTNKLSECPISNVENQPSGGKKRQNLLSKSFCRWLKYNARRVESRRTIGFKRIGGRLREQRTRGVWRPETSPGVAASPARLSPNATRYLTAARWSVSGSRSSLQMGKLSLDTAICLWDMHACSAKVSPWKKKYLAPFDHICCWNMIKSHSLRIGNNILLPLGRKAMAERERKYLVPVNVDEP